MSDEELDKQYCSAVSSYRHYMNTDDYGIWMREKVLREAARIKLEELKSEYKKRGLVMPNVP